MPPNKSGSKQPEKLPRKRKPKADGSGIPKNPNHPNLNAGGTPGNRGGGAPKNKIRELSISIHQTALVNLGNKLAKGGLSTAEELTLVDKAGKYGVGIKTEIEINNAALAQAVLTVMFKYCPEDMWQAAQSEIMAILDGGGDA